MMGFLATDVGGLAWAVAIVINKRDPDYFDSEKGAGGPIAVFRMVIDGNLPYPEYSRFIKFALLITRIMYALYMPLIILLFYTIISYG